MARTGEQENKDANKTYADQSKKAFGTGQTAISSEIAGEKTLESGQNVGKDPFQDTGYLANQNRLQSGALAGQEKSAEDEMEAQNQRTGGLSGGASPYARTKLNLQRMQFGDQLSAQRAAGDYQRNLQWQQYLLAQRALPAQLETPYYGTGTSGQGSALGNLTQFGLASYGPANALIGAAGGALTGGLMPGGAITKAV